MQQGRNWVYEFTDPRGAEYRLTEELKGGDVRSLPDQERVEFRFIYGTPAGEKHDVTKSIYAMAKDGPREYYFDAMRWSLWHDPPIPLLPAEVAVGREVRWQGKVEPDNEEIPATAVVRVESIENADTVRVKTTYGALPLEVTRWFKKGVGLVRMEMRANGKTMSVRLLSYSGGSS
ncbi:MAG: hypothetical protein ACYTGZ_15065 [Planctomycetota bacterium]